MDDGGLVVEALVEQGKEAVVRDVVVAAEEG